MTRLCLFFLGFLTQLASCADRHLHLSLLQMDPVPVARLDEARHAGMVGENQFILVSGKPDSWQPRTLVRIDGDASEQSLLLPTRNTPCLGEALILRGPRWWYSRCSGNGVQFVSSEAPGSPSFVAGDSALHPREWLPFEQDAPGGVLLSVEPDGRTVIASRVTPSGVQETLGRFDRGSTLWGSDRGQAVRLGTDSVALITIETSSSDPVHSSIVLRVIRNGDIATSRLAFHESGWASVAAAAGPNEHFAIVAAPFDESGVVALVVDPTQPDRATVRHLVRSAAAVPYPGLRLMANGNRFIATWIELREKTVRIAEFDAHIALPAVTVASDVGGFVPLLSLGHSPGEQPRDVAVFWTGKGGNVMLRRLPEPPTGFVIASDLLRLFSDWAGGRARQ